MTKIIVIMILWAPCITHVHSKADDINFQSLCINFIRERNYINSLICICYRHSAKTRHFPNRRNMMSHRVPRTYYYIFRLLQLTNFVSPTHAMPTEIELRLLAAASFKSNMASWWGMNPFDVTVSLANKCVFCVK